MGIDLIDVAFRVEKTFGIPLTANDFRQLVRNNDVVVGDLYDLIRCRLKVRERVRNDFRLNYALWEQLQQHLGEVVGVPSDEVELRTPLERLFPPITRRAAWERLRAASGLPVATLDYPRQVRLIGFALAATMAMIEQFHVWQAPQVRWMWPILGVAGIWIFAETYGKVMSIFAMWRIDFPKGMKTVKDMARTVVASSCDTILVKGGPAIFEGCDLPADDHSLAIWRQLREILSTALGVDVEQVTLTSRLVADLGAG